MKKIQTLIFPVFIILLIFLLDKKNINELYLDFEKAKQASYQENKPLLVIVDNEYNNNIKSIKNINGYIICLLNYQKDKKIIEEYKIKKIPSYMIIDNKTNLVYKEEGYKNKNKLIEWLICIKEKIKSTQ